jgi:hypothetical protein
MGSDDYVIIYRTVNPQGSTYSYRAVKFMGKAPPTEISALQELLSTQPSTHSLEEALEIAMKMHTDQGVVGYTKCEWSV